MLPLIGYACGVLSFRVSVCEIERGSSMPGKRTKKVVWKAQLGNQ